MNDIWYRAHHRLGWAFGIGREHEHPKDLKSPAQEWSDVLKAHDSTILISSEILFKCCQEYIQAVREYTSEYDVKIIVYLRRQDRMMNSVVNQLTKQNSETWTDIYQISPEHTSPKKDYFKFMQPCADVFGKENIIVRPYEKGQFYGGSIFSDFFHFVFSLELTDEFLLPERDHNSRLHRVALEYKRLINFLPLALDQKRNTVEPLRLYSQQLYSQKREDYDILSPVQCLEIIHQHDKSNENIAREYLGREDGRLFYDPLPDPSKPWKPYPGSLSNGDIKQISRLITERDPEFAKQLGWAIRINLKSGEKEVRAAAKKLAVGLKILMNRRETSEICKGCCVSAIRFTYRKLPARVQPGLKKVARKLKIVQKSEEGN